MRIKFIYFILFLSLINSMNAYAKTYAWLLDVDGKAQKLDVSDNSIVQDVGLSGNPRMSVSLQDLENAVVADVADNLLFIVSDYGRVGQWIGTYHLKDMSFIKKLDIESRDPNTEFPKVIVPPIGSKFYVAWWDDSKAVNNEGGERYTVYEKSTLNKISELPSFPVDLLRPWTFSADGNTLYSIDTDVNEIKLYNSNTLELKEAVSISSIWGAPSYWKGIEYLSRDKILFSENIKSDEGIINNYRFVYAVTTKELSRKNNIKETGKGILSPDSSKLIVIESSNSKIHIYDTSTGQELKNLDLSDRYTKIAKMKMTTISPDNAKLYLRGKNIQSGVYNLIVVDLKTYSVIAQLTNVKGVRMVFFEE